MIRCGWSLRTSDFHPSDVDAKKKKSVQEENGLSLCGLKAVMEGKGTRNGLQALQSGVKAFGLSFFWPGEGDEGDRARLLRAVLWMLLVLGVGLFAIDLVYLPASSHRWWIGLATTIAITVPLLFMLHRGYVSVVGVSLVLLLWLFVTVMSATGGGIYAMITQGYLIVTFMAGLLGGIRYGLLVGVLSLLTELVLVLFADRIPPIANRTPMSQWLVNGFYLITVMLLQSYSVRSLRRAFHRSAEILSERRRAEENLVESEERFRAIYDQTDLGVAMSDLDGCLVSANDAFCRMLGYSGAELVGRHIAEFSHEDDVPAEVARVKEVTAGLRRSYTLEKRYVRKDGTLLPVSVTVSLLRNSAGQPSAYLGIVEDISERYSAEAALRASEERFRITFESAGAGIALIDPEGRILSSNQALTDLTGFSADELIELNFRDFTHPDDLDADVQLYGELLEGKRERYILDKRYIRKNGSVVWARLTVSLVRSADHSRQSYAIAIVEDITEKKRTELELAAYRDELEEMVRERTEELRGALQIAEAATVARNEFLANVSHELRTPMNAVIGLTHLALGTDLNPRQREYLSKIRGAARDLLGLLNDLLDFSKMEAGRIELESVPFHLDRLLDSVLDLVSIRATEKNLQLSIDIAEHVPLHVIGDPMRLRQILINLAGNAVKFTDTGSVTLLVKKAESDSASLQLEFSIIDTGPGVPAALRPHLFEPFRQADGSMTRRYGGTGLGLAICRQLIEQMGGSIGLDDSFAGGSRFFFTLPFSTPRSGEVIADIPAIDEDRYKVEALDSDHVIRETRLPLPGRILVVEDNEINLQVARELLHSFGLSVDVARNGVEGVRKATSGEYQAILMDLQMPEMDGYEASRQIRQRHIETPILAMTAHALESEKKRCLAAGMNDHIPKPVDPDLLYRTLSRWLSLPTRRKTMHTIPETFDVSEFDVPSAVRRLDGDINLFVRLLEYFVRDHRDDAVLIEKALEAGDEKGVRRRIHTLRGAASNLSAREILSVLLEMDRLIEEHGWDAQRLKPFAQRLKNTLLVAIQSIEKALVNVRPEIARPLLSTDETLSLPLFDALLARQSLSARQHLEHLRPELEQMKPGLASRMAEAMDRLDYAAARKLLAPYIKPE